MGLGYQASAVLAVMARLGIADRIGDAHLTSHELAAATGAHPSSLRRFLRTCVAFGLLKELDKDAFALTGTGQCLRSDAHSMHGFALGMGQKAHLRPFEHLYEGVMENRSVAKDALGMEMWEFYDATPEAKATLTEHLDEVTAELAPHVVKQYDLTRFTRIVDVGGNQGHFLSAMLAAAPQATGVLFDRPETIEEAGETIAARGLGDRVEMVAGDFRESVPPDGDLYLLKGILHDWDDEPVAQILANCHRVARPGSSLLSLEGIVRSEPPLDPLVHLIDLGMLLLVGGRERTREEFDVLFEGAGYHIERTIPIPALGYFPYHIIDARWR